MTNLATGTVVSTDERQLKRATAASLVFSKIFFPAGDPTIALLASFATFGVAYVARPFGAVVFGHLGDKIGRKNTLVMTLVMMGSATFLIGVLPDFNTAGYWAPALLVRLRLMQGLSAGAETAGASALTTEEAPEGRRGFFASFAMSGVSAGIVLASLAFLPVAAMSEADRLSWGWRIPFWLSVLVLVVAFLVRRSLDEPEVFEKSRSTANWSSSPSPGCSRPTRHSSSRLPPCPSKP